MAGAQELDPVSTKQQRIAELAKRSPQVGFTSLNHHLDLLWLVEAYNRTRKDGAPGVDGQTGDDYGLNLLDNLTSLLDRAKSGDDAAANDLLEQHREAIRRAISLRLDPALARRVPIVPMGAALRRTCRDFRKGLARASPLPLLPCAPAPLPPCGLRRPVMVTPPYLC